MSGVLASTITAPRSSVPVAAAAPPAASAIVPEYPVTERSEESVSPSAIVVVNTRDALASPLE